MDIVKFERFSKDGIELVIDTVTGEVFYPGYKALARVASLGLAKPVQVVQAQRTVESALEGVTDLELKSAEILTQGGLQGVTLIPRQLGSELPDTDRLGGTVQASQFIGNRLGGSGLAPIPLWSYIASKGSIAGSQRQYPQTFISNISCGIFVTIMPFSAVRAIKNSYA